MEDWIVWVGIPVSAITGVIVIACIVSMIFARNTPYPKADRYALGEPWNHGQLLFSATEDAPVSVSHGVSDDLTGGAASGKW